MRQKVFGKKRWFTAVYEKNFEKGASLNVDLIEILTLNLQKFAGNKSVAFVLNNFEGADFSYLHAAEHRIFGPTILLECSRLKEPLPLKPRPLFCQSMRDVVVCFCGFKDKDQLTKLVALVHYMGGSVRKDLTASCTHVVSKSTQANKYRVGTKLHQCEIVHIVVVTGALGQSSTPKKFNMTPCAQIIALAVGMGRPVMSENWIFKCWERRFIPLSSAISEDLVIKLDTKD
uniref:BRCT domain-containing protein n=1 Tax=Romanomermis culicivorax TaxID=13658 RepID=A0A915J2C4_ROMCU